MATYSAVDVAAEVRRRLPGVPTKKLHKLLYYCQAHHLATFDGPLFAESLMAWEMGPVVGQLWYQEDRGFASTELDPTLRADEAALNTIGFVLSRYGRLSGSELERLSHSEDPWIDADRRGSERGEQSVRIELAAIAAYFRDQAASEEAEPAAIDQPQKATALDEAARFAETISERPSQLDERSRLRQLRAAFPR